MVCATVAPSASSLLLVSLLALAAPGFLGAQEPSDPAPVIEMELDGRHLDEGNDLLDYQARRQLLRYEPFEPVGVPEVPIGARTVFFQDREHDALPPQVLIQPAEEIAALPRAVFEAAGWLELPGGAHRERSGEVIGFAGDQGAGLGRGSVHPYDEVRIQFLAERFPAVGDELLLFRIQRTIEHLGEVVVPSGRARVIRVEGGGVVAEVVQQYDRVQIGHLVGPRRIFPLSPGVHPGDSDLSLEANLLAFQEEKELHLPGDFAFIDRGRNDGLKVGDEFVGLAGDGEGWAGRPVAGFQVVGLQDRVGTVRLTSSASPSSVRPGLRLMLQRTMP